MKDKYILGYSLIFIVCILLTAEVVLYELTGSGIIRNNKHNIFNISKDEEKCTDTQPPQRPATTNDQLVVVQNYEKACKSAFIDDMMLFTNMPVSNEVAQKLADSVTTKLVEFDRFGIKPIIIVEPDSEWGLVDFNEFANGLYDEWTDAYYAKLKANGIKDTQLGMIIPFPEPQQEFWNNNKDPDDFAKSVNRYFKIVRKYFPNVQSGILLDSQVSEKNNSQLIAYTRLIDVGIIDVVGLQGFPWHPQSEDDKRQPVITANKFAPASMLEEVAESLKVKDVLINTGTYRHRKAGEGGNIAISSSERKQTLDSIVDQTNILLRDGYNVTINIFAENKLSDKEGVNWSYWDNKNFNDKQSTHANLFTEFVKELKQKNVKISLFDRIK